MRKLFTPNRFRDDFILKSSSMNSIAEIGDFMLGAVFECILEIRRLENIIEILVKEKNEN